MRLIGATRPQLHPRAVLSHGSAAVVLGLPLFPRMVDTSTSPGIGAAVVCAVVVLGPRLPVREVDRVVLDGLVVTSLARTIVDLARTLPYDQGVAVADRGLALGVRPARRGGPSEASESLARRP